jgi:hypothetical protein
LNKEFLYIGHYYDINNNYILKIGTTKDLKRRKSDHTRNYRKAKEYTLPNESEFEYDWSLPLSKYNTLRYEDSNRQMLKALGIGEYIRNDRFKFAEKPAEIEITIRKTYKISL